MTSLAVPPVFMMVRAAGADRFLAKPLTLKGVVDAIQHSPASGFYLANHSLLFRPDIRLQKNLKTDSMPECLHAAFRLQTANTQVAQIHADIARAARYRVKALAALMGEKVRALEMHFLKNLQNTPHEWLLEQQSQEAKRLLKHHIPIQDCAEQLGYDHTRNLYPRFRQLFGVIFPQYQQEISSAHSP
jgi:AraC-like DNA-binding protein